MSAVLSIAGAIAFVRSGHAGSA